MILSTDLLRLVTICDNLWKSVDQLEFSAHRGAWEWDDITDVAHSCAEAHHSLEAKAEARMWHGTEPAQV